MLGLIHLELARFVQQSFGAEAWDAVMAKAGIDRKSYSAGLSYNDGEIVALVTAGVALTGKPALVLLEAFGRFLVPTYLGRFGSLVEPDWRTLDVIEHTEESIHKVVRLRETAALPPHLRAERTGPKEVVIHYDSPRRLCAVARGIALGVADHFGEEVRVVERTCMHRGEPECLISVAYA